MGRCRLVRLHAPDRGPQFIRPSAKAVRTWRRIAHRPRAQRLTMVFGALVVASTSLVVLTPSTAFAKGILGTGADWCGQKRNGGYTLQNHYVSTIGGHVYACGPVPVDGHDDTGPYATVLAHGRRRWLPVHGIGESLLLRRDPRQGDLHQLGDGALFRWHRQTLRRRSSGPLPHRPDWRAPQRPFVKRTTQDRRHRERDGEPGGYDVDNDAVTYGDVGVVTAVSPSRITLLVGQVPDRHQLHRRSTPPPVGASMPKAATSTTRPSSGSIRRRPSRPRPRARRSPLGELGRPDVPPIPFRCRHRATPSPSTGRSPCRSTPRRPPPAHR